MCVLILAVSANGCSCGDGGRPVGPAFDAGGPFDAGPAPDDAATLEDAGPTTCTPTAAEETTCDGMDDDCDGAIDEGLMQPCGIGVGECTEGVETCTAGSWAGCTAVEPTDETCNGLDDDCDGSADEDVTRACGSAIGACVEGVETCVAGAFGACEGAIGPEPETCNTVDDDCDGTADEELLTNVGGDIRITNDPANDDYVAAGWSGADFALVWSRGATGSHDLYFRTLDAFGVPASGETRLTTTGDDISASVAWNATDGEFGVVWSRDGAAIRLLRVRPSGSAVGSEIVVDPDASTRGWPWIDHNGTAWGVVWQRWVAADFNLEVYFARVASDGSVGTPLRITNASGNSRYANVRWTGSAWAVVWADERSGTEQIRYARVSADGTMLEVPDTQIVSSGRSDRWPNLDLGPGELGVTWHGATGTGTADVYFARVGFDGALVGSVLQLTTDPGEQQFASVDWTGTEYMVAWQDDRDGNLEAYFALVTAAGMRNGADRRITNAALGSQFVTALWTGAHYGIGWRDGRDGNDEVYFTYVGCP